jgi:hypothetical protein
VSARAGTARGASPPPPPQPLPQPPRRAAAPISGQAPAKFDAAAALRRLRAAATPYGGLRGAGLALARAVAWRETGTDVAHADFPPACDVGAVFVVAAGGMGVIRLPHADADADPRPGVRAAARAAYLAGACTVVVEQPAAAGGAVAPLEGAWSPTQREALWRLLHAVGADAGGMGAAAATPPPPALPQLMAAWQAAAAMIAEHAAGPHGVPHSEQSRWRRAARQLLAAAVADGARGGGTAEQLQRDASAFASCISTGTVREPAPATNDFGRLVAAAGWPWLDGDADDLRRACPRRVRPAGQHQLVNILPLLDAVEAGRG